jgi:hypothetical protein
VTLCLDTSVHLAAFAEVAREAGAGNTRFVSFAEPADP